MKPLFLVSVFVLLASCGSISAVDTSTVSGGMAPVEARVEAYLAADSRPEVAADYAVHKAAIEDLETAHPDAVPAAPLQVHAVWICDLHDSYVSVDGTIPKDKQKTYLRTTALIRRVLAEATSGL